MGTVKTLKAKLIVILIVFMMLFSNFGFTLSAIAASDEFEVINRGFFRKDEIKFDAYFEDEDGNKITELTKNVNENIKLVLEILPQVEGFLQDGTIRAVSADGSSLGFKFSAVSQNLLATTKTESSLVEAIKGAESLLEEPKEEVEKTEDEKGEEPATDSNTNTVTVDSSIQSILDKVSDKVQQADSDVVKTNPLASIIDAIGEEILVDENVIVEDEEDEETYEDKVKDALLDIVIESENEILLSNIIEDTKIVVDLEFVPGEKLDINNLLEEVKLQLSGTFINKNLKEVKIGKEEKVVVGWDYSKDIVVSSEFSKFSPFSVMDVSGTIVQNDITITRNINDSKYLPVKSTTIEVDVPKINDQAPIEINVVANKTLATNGEDVGETTFTRNNWSYDKENNKITIKTVNKEGNTAVYSHGEDQYVIIYRFKEYVEEEKYNLSNTVTVRTVEYSANTKTITKKIDETKEVTVKKDELLTSSIGTSSEKINKAKINANYNSEIAMYETEYKTQVRVNILTSDILENVKIDVSKEIYKSNLGLDFDADNVEIKNIKFNSAQLQEILANGGEIVLKNLNEEVLYIINKDLLKNENEIELKLNNERNLLIELNGIKRNGTIDFELSKVIGKCELEKEIFNKNITDIESVVEMKVKYLGMAEEIQLTPMATKKAFEKSSTNATLSVNKEVFSTTKENGNIEFKIELNNNNVNGDLYANPTFEIALPNHVKEIRLLSVNLLHGEEFEISDFSTYTNIDGTPRIKIDLKGVQTRFNSSELTNGTNIIINADIVVDEYTSSKKDQIKLYYCNEGVTNYTVQTKWSVIRNYSNSIIRQTNGYDAKSIEFKGPTGLLAINAIKNYDGNNNTVKSIKQGEKIIEVRRDSESRIATMELIVLNNTDDDCTETILLGRVPFKGNKDVVTREDLGTNVDALVKGKIIASEENTNRSKIYYSGNENADTDLNKKGNEWTENFIGDFTKSFMIVVEGTVAPGAILKYSYDFEIPSNLGYEVKMLGSFAAIYNRKEDTIILAEKTLADSVGIATEVGAKYEATMRVDVGNKAIGESRYLNYYVDVKNTGSVDLKDVKIVVDRPTFAFFCEKQENKNDGNNGYVVKHNLQNFVSTISSLEAGEKVEIKIPMKTDKLPKTVKEYSIMVPNARYDYEKDLYYTIDENNDVHYIDKLPNEFVLENKAKVTVEGSAKEYVTNIVKNKIERRFFDIEITPYKTEGLVGDFVSGDFFSYIVKIQNISGEKITGVDINAVIPKELKFRGINELVENPYEYEYNEETNEIDFTIGDLEYLDSARFYADCDISNMKNIGLVLSKANFTVTADNDIEEKSDAIEVKLVGPELEITHELNTTTNSVEECKDFEYIINIKNKGAYKSNAINIETKIPECLSVIHTTSEGKKPITTKTDGNMVKGYLSAIDSNETISFIILLKSEPLDKEELSRELYIQSKLNEKYIGDFELEDLKMWLVDDPDRELTEEEKQEQLDEELFKPTDDVETPEDEEKPIIDRNDSNNDEEKTEEKPDIDNSNNSNNNRPGENDSFSNQESNNVKDENDESNDTTNENNSDNNQSNDNSSNNTVKPVDNKVNITGKVWKDENKDGIKDDSEDPIRSVKVSIYDGNSEIKTCVTDSQGKYRFNDVTEGKYVVVFNYDKELYVATTYRKSGVPEDRNSDVIESEDGVAVTNEIVFTTDQQIDLGLQIKDEFDFAIEKYITKSIVKSGDKEKITEYENTALGKLEIRSKELKNSLISLEYTIKITNIGNVDGKIETIKDYLPKTLEFDEKQNNGWYLDSDEVLCNNTLKDIVLEPGDTKEIKLVLNKVMTEDNTGTIVNKVKLDAISDKNLTDNRTENNVATQELLITVSTGRTVQIVLLVACIAGFAVLFNFTNIKALITGKKIYK